MTKMFEGLFYDHLFSLYNASKKKTWLVNSYIKENDRY